VGKLEAIGALNFLDLDDIAVLDEAEPVDPRSIITLPIENERPMLPKFERLPNDPFLRQLDASGKKWAIIVDAAGQPRLVLDAHHFLRDVLFNEVFVDLETYWHRPIIVTDVRTPLGEVIGRMKVKPEHSEDDVLSVSRQPESKRSPLPRSWNWHSRETGRLRRERGRRSYIGGPYVKQ
jgi:metal transporter CNNM